MAAQSSPVQERSSRSLLPPPLALLRSRQQLAPLHPPGDKPVRFDVESLNYDIDASTLFEGQLHRRSAFARRYHKILRWVVCFAVGVTTGFVAFALDTVGGLLLAAKSKLSVSAMGDSPSKNVVPAWIGAFLTHSILSLLLVALSAALVWWTPVAAGSGIPEVKAYLQGVKVPGMLRTNVLFAKTLGVLCSVTGGLVVGKEGPMIHTGAIIAAGISQGSSKTCQLRTMWLKVFRNDHDKRDFVSAGAAAGVAAAFGAPIGGVLFAMEEAASYWSQTLTWRTFFCAISSTVSLNLMLSATEGHFGQLSHPGLITFGSFIVPGKGSAYELQELPIFALLGIAGGLSGALFNSLNRRLTIWRTRTLGTPTLRFIEALVIAFVTALLAFTLPLMVPCTDTVPTNSSAVHGSDHVQTSSIHNNESDLADAMHELLCGNTHQESPLGSLLLSSHADAIKILFHQSSNKGAFNVAMSVAYFFFSFSLGLVTYGLAVPSGLFVPAIMSGAAMGRLVGELLARYAPGSTFSEPGCYALMGAAAMLGGICRMTISITVIVVESTTSLSYLLPIALVITTAKLIGDIFNEGIYDMHIQLKRYPTLPDQPTPQRERLLAKHVMSTDVKTVGEIEQVGSLIKLLRNTPHNGYPVVARGGGSSHARVLGVITREQLLIILAKRQFNRRQPLGLANGSRATIGCTSPPLRADDFLRPWFNDFELEALSFTPDELEQTVTLSPYVNQAALVTLQNTSLRRVSTLFRSMGLRHLLVVESCPKVVGIITRKDIIMGGEAELLDDDDSDAAELGDAMGARARARRSWAVARRRVRRLLGRMRAMRPLLPSPTAMRSAMQPAVRPERGGGLSEPWLSSSPSVSRPSSFCSRASSPPRVSVAAVDPRTSAGLGTAPLCAANAFAAVNGGPSPSVARLEEADSD